MGVNRESSVNKIFKEKNMAGQIELKRAQKTFKTLCEMLDDNKWHYDRNDEKLQIDCKARGDDLAIDIRIFMDVERQLVILYSKLPFEVPTAKRDLFAIAVARANWNMVDGSFDYDYLRGKLIFRLTSSFRDSVIGKDLLEYVLFVSCHTVDEYNDKFEKLVKDDMTQKEAEEYIEKNIK